MQKVVVSKLKDGPPKDGLSNISTTNQKPLDLEKNSNDIVKKKESTESSEEYDLRVVLTLKDGYWSGDYFAGRITWSWKLFNLAMNALRPTFRGYIKTLRKEMNNG